MSRWIDADALIEKLKQHHDFFVKAWGGFREMPIQDKARCDELSNSIAEIFNAPSIDIVRCVECRYKGMEICPMYKLVVAGVRKYDDYCSYGERKESE